MRASRLSGFSASHVAQPSRPLLLPDCSKLLQNWELRVVQAVSAASTTELASDVRVTPSIRARVIAVFRASRVNATRVCRFARTPLPDVLNDSFHAVHCSPANRRSARANAQRPSLNATASASHRSSAASEDATPGCMVAMYRALPAAIQPASPTSA